MKGVLVVAGLAALGALAVAHAMGGGAAAPSEDVVVQTTEGSKLARYTPLRPNTNLPTFDQIRSGDPRFSRPTTLDREEGHEARDAVRAKAAGALEALVSADPCDPISREAYLAAMRRYIGARIADKADVDGVRPSGRWVTGTDVKVGGSLDLLQREGVISAGDMQRAMLGSTWQGKLMLMVRPPPRTLEERPRCPVGT